MLSSVFGKLRSPPQSPSSPSAPGDASGSGSGWGGQGPSDREEDGFLLVGESAIERSTVMPAHLTQTSYGGYTQAPPDYNSQAVDSRPWSAHVNPQTQLHHACNQGNTDLSQGNDQPVATYSHLVMADVPFHLSGELSMAQNLSAGSNFYAVPRLDPYNPAKYFYDFEHERSVMRETSHIAQ